MQMRSRRKRGMALLLALLVLPLMVILAFTATTMGLNNLNSTQVREDSKSATYVAEAGCEEGLLRLKEDITYSAPFVRSMGTVAETASVTILNNGEGASTVWAPNGATVPPGFAYILSVCSVQNRGIQKSFGMLCRLSGAAPSPWNYAAFGYASIDLTGNAETDSFDSSKGTYAATRTGWGDPAALTQGGAVGTNGIAAGSVNFSGGHARVAGQITIGRTGQESTVVSGTAGSNFLAGEEAVTVLASAVARPAVTVPALPPGIFSTTGTLPPEKKYADIQVSGSEIITLGNGNYVFDGLKLSGRAQLVLAPGAVANVYITGDNGGGLDFSGQGVANASGVARNLTFYVGPYLTDEISVTGNASAFFRVYAPNTPIKIAGNGDIFGSIVGKSIRNVGNAKIHYDRSLSSPAVPPDATPIYRQRF